MADPFAFARKTTGHGAPGPAGHYPPPQAPAPMTDPFGAAGGWHEGGAGGWGSMSSTSVGMDAGSMGKIGQTHRPPVAAPMHPQPHAAPMYSPVPAPHQSGGYSQQPAASPIPMGSPADSGSSGLFNPALALAAAASLGGGVGGSNPADLLSNPVATLAMHKGQELVSSSVAKYLPGAHALWRSLRYYFRVDNGYVRAKISRVMFPFTTKKWARTHANEADRAHAVASGDFDSPWSPPTHDTNAPDLYIPLMALATYVLATGLLQGMSMKFHPDLLQTVSSRSFAVLMVEVALLRFSLYALGVAGVNTLDLLAFGGYKFVALVINLLAGIFFGRLAYYSSFLYTSVAIFWFTTNTLMPLLRPELASRGQHQQQAHLSSSQTSQRNYLAIGAAALQCFLMWWMGSAPEASGGAIAAQPAPAMGAFNPASGSAPGVGTAAY